MPGTLRIHVKHYFDDNIEKYVIDDDADVELLIYMICSKHNYDDSSMSEFCIKTLAGDVVSNNDPITKYKKEKFLCFELRDSDSYNKMLYGTSQNEQIKYAEIIRKRVIESNLIRAYNDFPEVFTRVELLYLPIEIRGRLYTAMVDTGAQISILNKKVADETGLSHQLDDRFKNDILGVGSQKSYGKIFNVLVKVGETEYWNTFTVLDLSNIDALIGIDWLMKNRCIIDLRDSTLILESGERIKFLRYE